MPTMLPNATVIRVNHAHLDGDLQSLGEIFIAIGIVLLPPLLALVVTAACIGHGEISGASILAVLQAAGETNL